MIGRYFDTDYTSSQDPYSESFKKSSISSSVDVSGEVFGKSNSSQYSERFNRSFRRSSSDVSGDVSGNSTSYECHHYADPDMMTEYEPNSSIKSPCYLDASHKNRSETCASKLPEFPEF